MSKKNKRTAAERKFKKRSKDAEQPIVLSGPLPSEFEEHLYHRIERLFKSL